MIDSFLIMFQNYNKLICLFLMILCAVITQHVNLRRFKVTFNALFCFIFMNFFMFKKFVLWFKSFSAPFTKKFTMRMNNFQVVFQIFLASFFQPQTSQVYFSTSVWIEAMCCFREKFLVVVKSHFLHLNRPSP